MEFTEGAQIVALLLFMVGNWLLYHKIFNVTYFGSAGKGIFREILVSFVVAIFELALIETYPIVLVVIAVIVIVVYFLKK